MGARPRQQTLWALAYLIALVALPTAAALLRVYVRQDCLAQGYQLSVEQQRREGLRAQVRKAELTRARGRTPAALGAMANRLQLLPPRPEQTLGAEAGAARGAASKAAKAGAAAALPRPPPAGGAKKAAAKAPPPTPAARVHAGAQGGQKPGAAPPAAAGARPSPKPSMKSSAEGP